MINKLSYDELLELYEEACMYLAKALDDNRRLENELQLMDDFIFMKALSAELEFFRNNAVLVQIDDEPFPRYMI